MKKFLILLAVPLILQCTTVGPSGKSALVLIPTSQEVQIGQGTDEGIKKEYKVYKNAELEKYITTLGQKIAAVCDRQDVTYSFAILDTDMINAFAAPGGFIYVTTGILKFLDNEAQLAGVIGHEVGHVVGRHSVRALQKQYAMQYGMQLALGAVSDEQLAQLVQLGSTAGATIILQGYSRENEYESDAMGTLYAYKAGYNPYEMATFMGKLDQLSGGSSPKGLEKLFSSHPPSADRKKKITAQSDTIADAKSKAVKAKEFKAITSKLK